MKPGDRVMAARFIGPRIPVEEHGTIMGKTWLPDDTELMTVAWASGAITVQVAGDLRSTVGEGGTG